MTLGSYTRPGRGENLPSAVRHELSAVRHDGMGNDSTEGLVKLVVGRRGKLIGAGVVGASAGEITNLLSLAVAKGMSLSDLQGFVSPYPTLSEIGKRAATAYYSPYAKKTLVRRAIAFLRRFG